MTTAGAARTIRRRSILVWAAIQALYALPPPLTMH
jgi:hypothetical protein